MSEPVRPVTLRIVLAAAVSAFGLSAIAAALPAPQRLEDIQIGESGVILRVALLCRGRCEVSPSAEPANAGSFLIAGVTESLDLDLSGRGSLANRLRLAPVEGGSLLTIEADAGLNAAQVIDCNTDSGPARCVEFRFDHAARTAATPRPTPLAGAHKRTAPKPAAIPTAVSAPPPQPPIPSPGIRSEPPKDPLAEDAPFIGAVVLEAEPALRDPFGPKPLIPDLAAPERLAPPSLPPTPQTSTALKSRIAAPAPRSEKRFNFGEEMKSLLGKSADAATCEGAAARLSADAWALSSMVDLAFCKAASGALDEADADFSRLLAYTPDNHEALVGRGLIAFARGDRARGLDFFQDALNALPPIAESDRIAAAMGRY